MESKGKETVSVSGLGCLLRKGAFINRSDVYNFKLTGKPHKPKFIIFQMFRDHNRFLHVNYFTEFCRVYQIQQY